MSPTCSSQTIIASQTTTSQTPIPNTATSINAESILKELLFVKSSFYTCRRIPKAARFLAADKLAWIIDKCLRTKSLIDFRSLLLFASLSFNISGRSNSSNLTSKIKQNLNSLNSVGSVFNASDDVSQNNQKKKDKINLKKIIEAKVSDFDIKGAIKVLSSDDTLAPFDQETLEALKTKHPTPSRELDFPCPPDDQLFSSILVTEPIVLKAINGFPAGSSPGLDGLRPQHLKDIVSKSAGEAGTRALTAITKLCNFLLSGSLPQELCPILYGASLCALKKKDGGLRPIAVGNTFRRLTAKLGCSKLRPALSDCLLPHQLGVSAKMGCEAAIHSVRTYLSNPANMSKVLLKIDFKNAFNSVERDVLLMEIKENVPALYPFLYQCYRNPSELVFGKERIPSAVGAQQGDPCGPMAFSLAVQPIVKSMKSELNVWYLDDATIADNPSVVLEDLIELIRQADKIGLEINPRKCELFSCSGPVHPDVLVQFQSVAPGLKVVSIEELTLLGAPLSNESFENHVQTKIVSVGNLLNRCTSLSSHVAYTLIKYCLYVPKFNFLLRTSPFWKFPNIVSKLDEQLISTLEKVLNIQLEGNTLIQACLPINVGGLGVRLIKDICLPGFLSSACGASSLVSSILHKQGTVKVTLYDEALESWMLTHGDNKPLQTSSQRQWDEINIKTIKDSLAFITSTDIARFLALQKKESNSWLHAIPSANVATLLDDSSFHICVSLRLGCRITERFKCQCGSMVEENGIHGLSCVKSAGRFSRHSELNTIFHRALSLLHFHPKLEPSGISRLDGKRPDGITLTPWKRGQKLVWDVTCVDTLAQSYQHLSVQEASSAANLACKKKHDKYSNIKEMGFIFKGLAFETFGPFATETVNFVRDLGRMLEDVSGDRRAGDYLFQRLSLCVQRGNAASIEGAFPPSKELEDIFNL
ncbi:hypothetical protein WDU94_014016 [Cyamophila willieti]